jgi:hypothetical protein
MGKVLYEGDDFKRMHRSDMVALQRLVDAKKFGIFEVAYKDTKIKVEIKKKGDDTVVKGGGRYKTAVFMVRYSFNKISGQSG